MYYTPTRVLVVEDDKDDFHLTQELLHEAYGSKCSVTWVKDFNDAKEVIPKQTADVYLLDYQLGSHTGVELLNGLKHLDLMLPVIVLTGQCGRAADYDIMHSGAGDFLPKHGLTSELLERSIRYCAKRTADRQKLRETERMKAEAKAAIEAAEMKSRMLAKINHELRTPLTAILGFATLGLTHAQTLNEKHNCLEVIDRNGKYLLNIINDFLDLSKIESANKQINEVKFDIFAVVHEIVELMHPTIATKGIELKVVQPLQAIKIDSDPFRVRQVITNLLSNAHKFTASGCITIECDQKNGWANISVSDTGIGIKIEDQKKLFQPYYQLETKARNGQVGTGLGLELSRKIACALGGELRLVASQLGKGSTFMLSIPTGEVPMDLTYATKAKTSSLYPVCF